MKIIENNILKWEIKFVFLKTLFGVYFEEISEKFY